MKIKKYRSFSVLTAAQNRIAEVFDGFDRVYCSFSGGKDSSVMLHLVAQEARRRARRVGVLIIDLEAQYADTISHIHEMIEGYKDSIDVYWVCLPLLLRNAVSNFEPRWCCWDPEREDIWVRRPPDVEGAITDSRFFPFFRPRMEFEEFMVLFGEWYGGSKDAAAFVGIRADESLHRYCAIATWNKDGKMFRDRRWTTRVARNCYNVYPIYDWRTEDIWRYHGKHPDMAHNRIYDKMNRAGVKLSQQRLCQPYGDDQRRGLWLYHILEPETWYRVVARVTGANSGALYVQENGNITGYNKIAKPDGHTWESFCNLLLRTMPKKTREHYYARFRKFISGWHDRGYVTIPDEAPLALENKCWAPSWRRMCKVLLRNDYWCKGLGQTQPKSDAYLKYKELRRLKAAGESV